MTATPPIVDRETWQEQIDALRVREKAHTREGTRSPRRLRSVSTPPAAHVSPPPGRAGPPRRAA